MHKLKNTTMKKQLLILLLAVFSVAAQGQLKSKTYLAYIDQWKEIAVFQQVDYGIPASITMAQALLESAAGQSELALNANNHFGIKCNNDWMGGVYYYDDDSKGECFRHYNDAAESFKDHSLFLQRSRYATCFEIAVEDYEGWARRLKECGYATDPLYAEKLIKIIEDYRLDTLVNGAPVGKPEIKTETNKPLKAAVVHRAEPIMKVNNDPEPEYEKPLTAKEEREQFLLSHPKKRANGVPYIDAREGDTYANIAFRLNMRERDLREYNDALGRDLAEGDRVYMASKKNVGINTYVWTFPGLSFWKLCQEEGVHMEAVQKLNNMDPSIRVFRTREKLYLKKVKDDGNR